MQQGSRLIEVEKIWMCKSGEQLLSGVIHWMRGFPRVIINNKIQVLSLQYAARLQSETDVRVLCVERASMRARSVCIAVRFQTNQ